MSDRKIVYLAGPITGCSFEEAAKWREDVAETLADNGIHSISPLHHEEHLRGLEKIEGAYEDHPMSSGKGVTHKDRFSLKMSSIVLMNMLGATRMSGGTFIEAGWADDDRIPVILVIEDEGNPNEHAMLNEISAFRVNNLEMAVEIIIKLLSF